MTTTKWVIDPVHSEIGFKIRHLMIAHVSGNFKAFEAEVETVGEDFTTARILARIQAASINTNNLQRDEHLRSSDFFEAETYPEILFTSTKVEKAGDATFLLHGNFTLKGITRPLTLNVEYSGVTKDPWGGQRAGFVLSGKINRSKWGVTFNTVLETGGVALSDEVKINGEVQLVKQVASVAA